MRKIIIIFIFISLFVSSCSNISNVDRDKTSNELNTIDNIKTLYNDPHLINNIKDSKGKIISYCNNNSIKDVKYVFKGKSMYPLFNETSKVFVQIYVNGSKLHVGEIIIFKSPDPIINNNGLTFYKDERLIHRIIGFRDNQILTRGDNNPLWMIEYIDYSDIYYRVCELKENVIYKN